jgi:hypothetical protein
MQPIRATRRTEVSNERIIDPNLRADPQIPGRYLESVAPTINPIQNASCTPKRRTCPQILAPRTIGYRLIISSPQ